MSDYTRVTVRGSTRRADLVVPSGEPIGALIPRLMDLLEERPGAVSRPLALVRLTGEQLDLARALADQGVVDGELLRLVREDKAPPPPEVADVTDVLADAHAQHVGAWSATARAWTAAVAALVLSAAITVVAARLDPTAALTAGAVTIVVALLVAVLVGRIGAGRSRTRRIATVLTAAALGTVPVTGALTTAAVLGGRGPFAATQVVLVVLAIGWAVVAVGYGLGTGRLAAWWGGLAGVVLSALPVVLLRVGVAPLGALGVGLVAATVVCGLLPWYAMSASGLTGLDDQVVEGRLKRRDVVLVSVGDAYRSLSWSSWAVAAPVGVLAATLLASGDGWAAGLAVAGLVVTASRTRTLPLVIQVAALWAAAIGAVSVAAVLQPAGLAVWGIPALAALVVVALVASGADPPEHRRAALRRIADVVETVAVIAQLPLLVGSFGIYAELLGAF